MTNAISTIKPTRIELLRLRRREIIAKKGRDILQEKLDALTILYEEKKAERIASEKEVKRVSALAYDALANAGMMCGFENLWEISYAAGSLPDITMDTVRIAGVKVPKIHYIVPFPGERDYSFIGTSGAADEAVEKFKELLSICIRHAEIYGTEQSLIFEISSCRRRVNALTGIVIPSLAKTGRYIEMHLEEREREDLFRRKRTKQLILHKEQGKQDTKTV